VCGGGHHEHKGNGKEELFKRNSAAIWLGRKERFWCAKNPGRKIGALRQGGEITAVKRDASQQPGREKNGEGKKKKKDACEAHNRLGQT